jgi:hypothetical protein
MIAQQGTNMKRNHIPAPEATCWRIRLNDEYGNNFSQDAWDRNQVGVWYGAWSVEDFETAKLKSSNSTDIAAEMVVSIKGSSWILERLNAIYACCFKQV